MPPEAAVNSAPVENDSVQPSTDLNDSSNWDYDDEPAETPVNAAKPGEEIDPNSEPDASEEDLALESEESGQPPDETDTEAEDAPVAPVEVTVPDDALVTLANGEKVKFSDLKKAPMLEKDYRHKTQELGNQRRALGEQATRIQNVTEAFVNYLAEQIPAEPSYALSLSDPGQYVQQKAFYDAQVARIHSLIEKGSQAKSVTDELSAEQRASKMEEANDALMESLPQLRDPVKRKEFNQQTWDTARHFGYSAEELSSVSDHRLLVLGHYAALGLKAEKAQKTVAQKVQAAPAATPAKRAAPKGDSKAFQSINAMRRLEKSGSIHDAMDIDFSD